MLLLDDGLSLILERTSIDRHGLSNLAITMMPEVRQATMPLTSGYSPSSETCKPPDASQKRRARRTDYLVLLAFSFNHPHVPHGAYGSIVISRSASPTAPLDDQSSTTASAVLSIWSRWVGSAGILADYELPFQIRSSRGYGEADHPEHRRGKRRWRQRGREDVPADALVLPSLVITFSCA